MEFLGLFRDFDIALIAKYMTVELLIGAVIGLISKQVAKSNASSASDLHVVPARDYTSSYFGRNFPRHAFDTFRLPPEFVIVQSANGEILGEEFFTFLGSSTKARYENGEYKGHSFSALTSSMYFCTVVIPIVAGFFPALTLPFGKAFIPLLFSGVTWLFIGVLIQTLTTVISQVSIDSE